jgi:5-hydroxyisourate hydrolase-like protein (transthyretin family)
MKNNLTYPITQSLKIIMALAVLTFSPVIAQPKQILAFTFAPIKAQTERIITGEIIEQQSGEPVPFANLALFEVEDSKLISGGTTNLDGRFELEFSSHGNLQLRISAVGFETVYKDIEFINHAPMDLGTIYMVVEEINLAGVVVAAERIKAISGIEKTSYMVNRNMLSASNTGTDLLKLVPGISLDIRQNISLEGNQNIMILVNGMERDRDFVAQIPATRIDKIEVSSQPSSRYDASVSGVINIILIKEKDAGFEGQIYLEVPTSGMELYLFPKYNFRLRERKGQPFYFIQWGTQPT